MFYVPDLDEGITYDGTKLGLALAWRTADSAGLLLRDGKTEIVLQTQEPKTETDVKVDSVKWQVEEVVRAWGKVLVHPFDIPIGKCAVVADPLGNRMVILDSSKGTYRTDPDGNVAGIATPQPRERRDNLTVPRHRLYYLDYSEWAAGSAPRESRMCVPVSPAAEKPMRR